MNDDMNRVPADAVNQVEAVAVMADEGSEAAAPSAVGSVADVPRRAARLPIKLGPFSPQEILEMRDWVGACDWADIQEDDDIDLISDKRIIRGIQRHYWGGLAQFIADGG